MKIKNYIPVILCSIALCSCSDADKNVAFGLDSDAIKAEAAGGTHKIKVSASGDWVATTDEPWISISPANGRGTTECRILIDSALTDTPRRGVIRIQEQNTWDKKEITIDQQGFDYAITLGEKEVSVANFSAFGTRHFDVKVKTNVDFAVEVPASAESWLKYDSYKVELDRGIRPRCHFEDITRADFYGFVLPFAEELMYLSEESGLPIKIRACDTMGYGVHYYGAALPRSVPGIIYGLHHYARVPSEQLEWHGHNDFYKVVSNAGTAWMYGCSSVNCSLLGIGERTGNCPLEAMAIEYASLRGTLDGMDLTAVTEIAEYMEREIGIEISPRQPFVGRHFNVTRAGIHADGLLKDEEIYNICLLYTSPSPRD